MKTCDELVIGQLVSSQAPIQDLVGRWVEDESVRTGLNDFLWARGNYKSMWHTHTALFHQIYFMGR